MKLKLAGEPREFDVEIVAREGDEVRVRIDGEELRAHVQPAANGVLILVGNQSARASVRRRRDSILVALGPEQFDLVPAEAVRQRRTGGLAAAEIAAPMPGKVLKILVAEGDQVASGTPLLVLEAMKMETTLAAESPATIAKLRVAPGEMVDHGTVLIEFSPPRAAPSAPESAPPGH